MVEGEQTGVQELSAALKRSEERVSGLEGRLREASAQAEKNRHWYHSRFADGLVRGLLKIGGIYVFLWGCYTFFQPQIDKAIDNIPKISQDMTQTMHEWNGISEKRLELGRFKIEAGYVTEETYTDSYGRPVTHIERVGPAAKVLKDVLSD